PRPRVRARGPGARPPRRRLRPSTLVLLRDRDELLRGDREAPRGAPALVGAPHGALPTPGPPLVPPPRALPDVGGQPDGAATAEPRGAHGRRGPGRRLRGHADPAPE